jgi:hypothetical protein
MEDSWTCEENEEMRCIEAAPRRMRMASRGEMLLKRERRDRYIVKRRGGEDEEGTEEGTFLTHPERVDH